jgi:16S rRNA (guanine527-N7)-methyltransferase
LSAPPGRLDTRAREALERVLALIAADPRSLSAVRDPKRGWDIHVADALAGLDVPELAEAARIADLGAGAGFPGLPLAAALPRARVDLIESVRRKADFVAEAIADTGLHNARAIAARSEEWARDPPPAGGREAYDAVVARAVGALAVVAELASPLLRDEGVLVAWKGRRNPSEEQELADRAPALAMAPHRIIPVRPYPASRDRHLHLVRKVGPTPPGLPRRPGAAAKRSRSRRPRRG